MQLPQQTSKYSRVITQLLQKNITATTVLLHSTNAIGYYMAGYNLGVYHSSALFQHST